MTLDVALNLIWLAIGVIALAGLGILEIFRYRSSRPARRLQRLAAVLLVTVALFPCVSFSDDLFHFSWLLHDFGKHGSGATPPEDSQEKSSLHLLRALQTLDHWQVCGVFAFALTLCFYSFVCIRAHTLRCATVLRRPGRAPPTF